MGDKPLYYWDACIFYERLKGEAASATQRAAVGDLLMENKAGENAICTSAITHAEVFPKRLGADGEEKYWGLFGSMTFFDIPIDRQVLMLARELRDFYYVPNDPDDPKAHKMLSTGDAFHLATAIANDVSEFHTRDGLGKKNKGGNIKLIGLADSDGKIGGHYRLKIVSPDKDQGDFFAGH